MVSRIWPKSVDGFLGPLFVDCTCYGYIVINIQLTFLDMFILYVLHGGIGVKSNSEDKARQ